MAKLPRIILTVLNGDLKGKLIVFDEPKNIVVGRSRSAHLSVLHDDKRMSRLHCVFEYAPEDGVFRVLDLGSRNGVLVNKEPPPRGRLKHGDVVFIGPLAVKVKYDKPDEVDSENGEEEKASRPERKKPEKERSKSSHDVSADSEAFYALDKERDQKRADRKKKSKTGNKSQLVKKSNPQESASTSKKAKPEEDFEDLAELRDDDLPPGAEPDDSDEDPPPRKIAKTKPTPKKAKPSFDPLALLADESGPAIIDESGEIPKKKRTTGGGNPKEEKNSAFSLGDLPQANDSGSMGGSFDGEGRKLELDLSNFDPVIGGDPASSMTDETPEDNRPKLPGFKVDRLLGKGVLGSVYFATKKDAEGGVEDFAVKVIQAPRSDDDPGIDRFVQEVRPLLDLDHPNIVPYREVGKAPGYVYIASDYHEGTDAAAYVRDKGPMPIGKAAKLFYQLLLALDYAHESEVFHRDIKPSNILVSTQAGRELAFFTDFGLAMIYNNSPMSGVKSKVELEHSVRFTAPEQINNFKDATAVGDIYSLGASLYYVLTGKNTHDFDTMSFDQAVMKIKRDDPVPIGKRRMDISPGLSELIHASIQRLYPKRLNSVEVFRKELAKFIK